MTNFALLQTNIAFCDPEANFKRVRELFAQAMAKDPRPDVVVLPEDWSAGFSDEMFHHMEDFVEPENGPSVTVLRELARQYQVWVVGGSIATLHADGKMRNTTFLIDRRGEIVGDYSKMHLYSDMDEHVPFANGDKTEVYDTELGRLGMMICYDIRFCELARTYALKKADVLVVTSDFPNPRVRQWFTLAHPSDRPRHREPDVCGGLQPGGPQPYGDLLRPLHHHRSLGRHHRGGRR